MGRDARRSKGARRVRTGDEVRAHFADRLKNQQDRMLAERLQPDWRPAKQTVHADGSRTAALSPLGMEMFQLQAEMFRYKFGREMGPEDFIFFDLDADVPRRVETPDEDAREEFWVEESIRRFKDGAEAAGLTIIEEGEDPGGPDIANGFILGRRDGGLVDLTWLHSVAEALRDEAAAQGFGVRITIEGPYTGPSRKQEGVILSVRRIPQVYGLLMASLLEFRLGFLKTAGDGIALEWPQLFGEVPRGVSAELDRVVLDLKGHFLMQFYRVPTNDDPLFFDPYRSEPAPIPAEVLVAGVSEIVRRAGLDVDDIFRRLDWTDQLAEYRRTVVG